MKIIKTETYSPKWSMSTVPHSGTRYIREAFRNEGISVKNPRVISRYIDSQTELMYGHCDVGHENWMDLVHKTWPPVRHFLVIRNPIHMLATHYQEPSKLTDGEKMRRCNEVRNNLDLYARIQAHFIKTYDPYIHRVEDPIEQLGEWAGVDLKPHEERHSRPNELRFAIDARDADLCYRTIRISDLWEWFTTTHSANIAPLYRDQLGYDFWWYNG